MTYRLVQIHYIYANSNTSHRGSLDYITYRLHKIHYIKASSKTLQAGSNTTYVRAKLGNDVKIQYIHTSIIVQKHFKYATYIHT